MKGSHIFFLIIIFLVAGIVIGYYGDICYACAARKKYLLSKLGLQEKGVEITEEEIDCVDSKPTSVSQGMKWYCLDGKWIEVPATFQVAGS